MSLLLSTFFSGCAALIYEIVLIKKFGFVFGNTVDAMVIVLGTFMLGLGFGSYLAGKLSTTTKSLKKLYFLLELLIFGFCFTLIFAWKPLLSFYEQLVVGHSSPALIKVVFAFGFLVLPTLCMGATLPMLTSLAAKWHGEDQSFKIYAVNALGGALGCALASFALLPYVGILNAVLAAGLFNFASGSLILLNSHKEQKGTPSSKAVQFDSSLTWVPIVTGFTALAYQIVGNRLLSFYIQSTTDSFALILMAILISMALGCLFFRRLQTTEQLWRLIVALLFIQGLLFLSMPLLLKGSPQLLDLFLEGFQPHWSVILMAKFFAVVTIFFPQSFVSGLIFALVIRHTTSNEQQAHHSLGLNYFGNTIGSTLGIGLTYYVFIENFGLRGAIFLLALFSWGSCLVILLKKQRLRFAGLAFLSMVAFISVDLSVNKNWVRHFYNNYHGKILYFAEAKNDVTMVVEYEHPSDPTHPVNGLRSLQFHDGRGTCMTDPNNVARNRYLAYSNMVMHPQAKDILVISMGCGHTAHTFTEFPIRSLDIVDISKNVFSAAQFFPENHSVVNDPRVTTIVNDGRSYLIETQKKYDVISLEMPILHTDGVINLYTKEFYEIARKKLKPGGILSQWVDSFNIGHEGTKRLVATMTEVFPQATLWQFHTQWWVNGVNSPQLPKVNLQTVRQQVEPLLKNKDPKYYNFEKLIGPLQLSGNDLLEFVKGYPIITDNHTQIDYTIYKMPFKYAYGGGLAYGSNKFTGEYKKSIFKSKRFKKLRQELFPEKERARFHQRSLSQIFNL